MIIGIALLYIAFFSVTPMPKWLDFKPFNCAVCLSFWSAICLQLIVITYPISEPYINALCMAGICAYVAIVFKRLIFKL